MVKVVRVKLPLGHEEEEILKEVGEALKEGKIAIYPTDTVYGIGTTPFSEDAVQRLIEVKKRPKGKHLPILASSIKEVEKEAYFNKFSRKLAEEFWPGPLTIILPLKRDTGLAPSVHAASFENGFRVPDHPVALKLIEYSGGLLIGTSANLSGMKPPLTLKEALGYFKPDEIDYAIDCGPARIGVPSTVVKVLKDGSLIIIREGAIDVGQLIATVKDLR